MKARIITPWAGDGLTKSTAHIPLVAARYSLGAWTDVTGSVVPVSPNLVVIEADLTQAVHDQIAADTDFVILHSGDAARNGDGKPTAGELAALRTWLRNHGLTLAQAAAIVLAARARRREVAADIAAWLKTRPHP